MADLIDRNAAYDAIGFERCNRSCADCPTKCTWFYTVKNIPTVNRWISCSERLPERGTDVLVYIPVWEDNPIQVAHLMYDGITWELSDGEFNFGKREVLYWMPLPEPPEGGAEDE